MSPASISAAYSLNFSNCRSKSRRNRELSCAVVLEAHDRAALRRPDTRDRGAVRPSAACARPATADEQSARGNILQKTATYVAGGC